MTINEWFSSGCDYKQGLALYEALPNHNKNLLKVFTRKETLPNKMKLKYELQKNLKATIQKASIVSGPIISTGFTNPINTESKYYKKVLINQLPIELHPLYIQQKTDYNTYCSLKIQLNELTTIRDSFGNLVVDANGNAKVKEQTPADIEKANRICLQIEDLFDAIDKAWEIIDHYLETKEVIKIQDNSFENLSPGKLRDKLISVRGSITRQNKRKENLTKALQNAIAKKFKIKYERDLAKCTAKLMQLEQDKLKLIQLRNNEK